ncbi:MAG: hypothetical protein IT569_04505 [Leptospiraceae bacterium]|nr:hypothetical protein [Leptospiraceae bacterium]
MKLLYNKSKSRSGLTKKNQIDHLSKRDIFPEKTRAMIWIIKAGMILLLAVVASSCSKSHQLEITNPFPEKDIFAEEKNAFCGISEKKKVWYVLYGRYPISDLDEKELFPSSDHTYRVEQKNTLDDKLISILTTIFFTASRKTLIVKTCKSVDQSSITDNDEISQLNRSDSRIHRIEKEITVLKKKISGIETMIANLALRLQQGGEK